MDVCTIIAKNYVAYARVLARSLAAHNPESRLWTLIIDDFSRYIDPAEEPFNVLTPADIGCEPFMEMALRYSALELSTAVKPWLLRHLMAQTSGPVTYLDPDIKVYGSLGRLDALAARHGVVLIPHNNAPIPADGRKPSQIDIMLSGVYNLGYVSVAPRPEIERLLDWWSERLRRDCRVDHAWGYFVDQRWFDLAPGFLTDLAIVREPEYNVAYWNLHSRELEYADGHYLVDGRPLAFFHFSGFDPAHPLILSYHQDRIEVTAHPVLERILAEYAAEVMHEGHRVSQKWPYSYGALGDGTRIDETIRVLYDDFADQRNEPGLNEISPFTLEGATIFKDWLRGQAPEAPAGVSRALARVYADRADLRRAYPELADQDARGLLRWAEHAGRSEVPVLAWAAATNGRPAAGPASQSVGIDLPRVVTDEPLSLREGPWGVNVVGCTNRDVEAEEAAPLVVSALDAQRIPALPIDVWSSRGGEGPYLSLDLKDAPFPVNVICLGPDTLPELGSQAGSELFAGRYSIGLWLWPLSTLPERLGRSSSLLEEVWAPSSHAARALEPLATVPVSPVRLPVQPAARSPRSRVDLGLPHDKFLFLFSFDYLSGFKRKNPLALVEAFRAAFADGEDTHLLLRCINAERDSRNHAQLVDAASSDPGIEVIDSDASGADTAALTALCDCYVSLHRAEAFGLDLATAMWHGKPVIATGYSGNLDFMTSENSMLVDYGLEPVGTSADPYPATAEWANPSVEHAAALMRRAFDDRAAAARLGARAAEDIRRTHSVQAAGEIMSRRLESIRATGRARRSADRLGERPPALARLSPHVRDGLSSGSRATGTRRALRKLVLRMMRPFTAYQQGVNSEVVSALDELNQRVAGLRREIAGERAELLAELRRYEELKRGSAD